MATALDEPRTIAHPTLENGAVMTREEFHRLYADREEYERVELIEGTVFLPSRVKVKGHAEEHALTLQWLSAYVHGREGISLAPVCSLLLDDVNEPLVDAVLFRDWTARFDDGYLARPPELIVEIALNRYSRDLHQKKAAYERNGVLEYIVWRTQDKEIDWFELQDGRYAARQPDSNGIIESRQFPGLRLKATAMLALDRKAVLSALRA